MSTPITAALTTSDDANARFMARVVAWPDSNVEPGLVNLHWKHPSRPGMPGRPFRVLQDFMQFAKQAAPNGSRYGDLYFCLSTQSQLGKLFDDVQTAARGARSALKLKSIWLDVDGNKATDRGYATKSEALDAFDKLVFDAELPPPSAVVDSGNGYHIYWIAREPMTVEEWSPYAHGLWALVKKYGLKADSVTTDCARVLRIPGTFNRKAGGQKAVRLVDMRDTDYDFPVDLVKLRPLGITAAVKTRQVARPFDLTPFGKPDPILAHLDPKTDSLTSGLTREYPPLVPDEIIAGCPMFRDAAVTNGKNHPQGMWALVLLATTFWEDGKRWAHYMSKGYPSYNPSETDAKYEEKVRYKAERGLGWPSCQAFENAGCKLCDQCAHKGKIKSPLNLALLPAPQPAADTEQAQEGKVPVARILTLHKRGVDRETLFTALNESYAVTRLGSEVLIASITALDLFLMKLEDFHKMFANVRVPEGNYTVAVSQLWLKWSGRRQFLGRGVVFEPGGLPEIADDMLNLWRGFGIDPKQGDWSLMRNHMLNVLCSGQQAHFDYLIRWMAYAVQHPDRPIGVAIAFRGSQGAGKGIVARTFGKFFGKHFAHIANGDQLTGRFNASLATSCAVFLDEALWAGDKKGEGVLKALITEPRLQLEAKFRDPIMVDNRLRIIVASNNDWCVPTGIGDRRWFILDVANTFAGTAHKQYWDALYAEIENGGAAAMFYDLLNLDLSAFDVRAIPHTAAKAQQQAHSMTGTDAWLYHVLQEGKVGSDDWQNTGLTVSTDHAYHCYEDFSKRQRAWRPEIKDVWSRKIRAALGPCVVDTRPKRVRSFQFTPLADCRRRFEIYAGAPNIEWDPHGDPGDENLLTPGLSQQAVDQTSADVSAGASGE